MENKLTALGFQVISFPHLILAAVMVARSDVDSLIDVIDQMIKDCNDREPITELYYNFRHWHSDKIMEVRISKL